MLNIRDNTPLWSTKESLADFMALERITNRSLVELDEDSSSSLLVYPYSFQSCEDDIGRQRIATLHKNRWEGNVCTSAVLTTGNLVGYVGVQNTTLDITSRFCDDEGSDYLFLYLISKVIGINIVDFPHSVDKHGKLDLLPFLFPKMLTDAMRQGLFKKYRTFKYNDSNIRGEIDVDRHIQSNIPFRGQVAYNTRELSYDNDITQLVRHTIEYLKAYGIGNQILNCDAITKNNVAVIVQATPSYDRRKRQMLINKNLRPLVHPYYSRYRALQTLCLAILRNEKCQYSDSGKDIYGLLFDMSWMWEEYLARLLSTIGFLHPNNRKMTDGIYLDKDNRYIRYPDYYNQAAQVVADAKYKREIDNRDDVNQMVTYMYRLKAQRGIFILPTDNTNNKEEYTLRGYGDNSSRLCVIRTTIPQHCTNYESFAHKMDQEELFLLAYIRNNMEATH